MGNVCQVLAERLGYAGSEGLRIVLRTLMDEEEAEVAVSLPCSVAEFAESLGQRRGEGEHHTQPAFRLLGISPIEAGATRLAAASQVAHALQLKIHLVARLEEGNKQIDRGLDVVLMSGLHDRMNVPRWNR
jgi:hypothetical protein